MNEIRIPGTHNAPTDLRLSKHWPQGRGRFGLEHFGVRLRAARKAKGWTQKELANRLAAGPSWISHFECGRRLPSLELLESLCQALEVSADSLMGLSS